MNEKLYMNVNTKDAGVNFPDYWDTDKVLRALTTLDTYELYKYFGCANSTSFTRLMKPCFPNRPERTSYSNYARSLCEKEEKPKWNLLESQRSAKAREEAEQFE